MSDRRVALITGASAGLGLEFARSLAASGHDVVLVARRRDRLEALAAELSEAHGVTATVIAADLSDPEAPGRIVAETGGAAIDVLVNNAGFGSVGPIAEADLPRELAMVQVNVLALMALTGLLLPGMVARGRGRILNVGSTAGFQPGPFMATYYATKAFVNHWTEALAVELSGTGVTATVSCPGATSTEFSGVSGTDKSLLVKTGEATAESVVRGALAAMMRGEPMIIHGLKNTLLVQSLRVSPRAIVRQITARLNRHSD